MELTEDIMCNNPSCKDCNMAIFVADYVKQELEWGNPITGQTIRDAEWAFDNFRGDQPLCPLGVPESMVIGGSS